MSTPSELTVQCRLDENTYDKGIKVSDTEMAKLNIRLADFHGDGIYTIEPETGQMTQLIGLKP